MAPRRFSKTAEMAKVARRKSYQKAAPGEGGGLMGALCILAGIILLVVGACAFLFPVDVAAPRGGVLLAGAFSCMLGIASLTYYFHKWGQL